MSMSWGIGKDTLVDLNFKVPPEFRDRFKRHAFEERLKNIQLPARALGPGSGKPCRGEREMV
jgi:hypothetical protein